ncbi:MAG: flagellar filament capping protein FliD, partial [Pirellulales bacterium]
LTTNAVGGVLTGERLLAGLKTSFISSLNGGAGLGTLGQIQITDRAGATATVDLSTSETLADVIDAINVAAVGIQASVNDARTGLVLQDTTGSTANNLVVTTADATLTAEKLGIVADVAQVEVDSGSLYLQSIGRATQLRDLNGGDGVFGGTFQVFDSNLAFGVVKLNQAGAEITTVGGVIDAINNLGIGVQARINDTGDGILVLDTAGGTQDLEIKDLAGGTTAADLNLAGTSQVVDIGGTPTPVIDGSFTVSVNITADDTLGSLVTKINDLDAGFRATIFNDGSALDPYRISITRTTPGGGRPLLIDSGSAGIEFQEVVRGQDALLLVGSANRPGAGVLASSSTNTFDEVLEGVTLNIEGTSDQSVTIDVAVTDESVVNAVQGFVDAFNGLVDKVDDLTFFSDVDNTTGVLFGSNETLRVETELGRLVTGRFTGVGRFQTLAAVGVSIDDQGKLSLDGEKLQAAFADDPEAVTDLFSTEELGVSAKFNKLIESLAGEDSSLLVRRAATLADKIKTNDERIAFHDLRLDRERERLLLEFFRIEETVSKLRGNLTAIQALQAIPPLSVGSSG